MTKNNPKIAIIGATGLVGKNILTVLEDKNFLNTNPRDLLLIASNESVKQGFECRVDGQYIPLISLDHALAQKPYIIIMSVGEKISKDWAKEFLLVNKNAWVIDNSPAWRMDKEVPLILPHFDWQPNKEYRIIPVSNCVAIMLATALFPLLQFDLSEISATVQQSASGAGNNGVDAWIEETRTRGLEKALKSPFRFFCFNNIQQAAPLVDDYLYNVEEEKVMQEIEKIFLPLHPNFPPISPSCFRSSLCIGHWAQVRLSSKRNLELGEIQQALQTGAMIKFFTDPQDVRSVLDKDYALVSGLRIDKNYSTSQKTVFEFTVSSDNLRLGAATTAVGIAEKITTKIFQP